MKKILFAVVMAGVLAASNAFAGDVQSLRGAKDIDSANNAPENVKVVEKAGIERNYRQQPPIIPHKIEKEQINNSKNTCLRCHAWPNNKKEGAPPVSETHYRDRDGNITNDVAGTRWFCTQCHVPQTTAKPLVENTFEPAK